MTSEILDTPASVASPASAATASGSASEQKSSRLELIIVVLLGLVSVTTAYASFQAAIYDSAMASSYTKAQTTSTEAESLYQEASQVARQNENVWNRMVDLQIEMDSGNPDVASMASFKWEQLYFTSVSDELESAMDWANLQNEANPAEYTSPLESEEYYETLFADYQQAAAAAETAVSEGDAHNSASDRLTLNTVLMAISLFLLGIAAVLGRRVLVVALTVISTVIYAAALALTMTIPMMWV